MTRKDAPNFVVKALTSVSVWEFIDAVSRMIDLAPQYVELKLMNGKSLSNVDYGKTLAEMGFVNRQILEIKLNGYFDTGI